MEENNSNGIVKWLAITIIAILGINVYRTETTKKEMNQLATTVGQLSAKLDSLEGVAPSGKVRASGIGKKEFSSLSKAVSSLETKVAALQGSVDRLSRSQSAAGTSSKTPSTATSTQNASTSTPIVATKTTTSNGPVSVSVKAKVENRYVRSTSVPKISIGPAGVVIIDVIVTKFGDVTSVAVNGNSTINGEEIIDACKEAALKTNFSYNSDAPDKTRGIISCNR